MMKKKTGRPPTIIVFHGAKHWTPNAIVRARSIEYMIGRGSSLNDAIDHAKQHLLFFNDFSNRSLLEGVMIMAQRSGAFSPFVSTSRRREVARSFALSGGSSGFILTIEGPEDAFYDFNRIRDTYGIPHPTEFEWLEELGIPLEIGPPLKVIRVDEVHEVVEVKTKLYATRKSRKK